MSTTCRSNWVKIKGAQLKMNLDSPIVHWMLIKICKGTMMIRYILTVTRMQTSLKISYASFCQYLFELWVAITLSGSIRSPWFSDNFWSASNALSVCVSWFLIELFQFLPNLNHMISHGLNPLGLRFNGLYFKSYLELACPTLIFSLKV